MTYYPFGATTYNLQSSISSTATSITLTSFEEPVTGTPYTMVLLNTDIAYATIQPKTTSSEFISFTGITQNADGTATLTGVTRGLAKKYPFITDSSYKLPHAGQSQFIISDAPQVFVKYGALDNDEVITGQWEAPNPTTTQGLVTNQYMLDLINGGTVSLNSITVAAIAGETITKDQLVYLKVSDGRWWKCDADTASTVNNVTLGLAQGAGTAGSSISGGVLTYGLATLTAFTVTAATKYYASNTAGGISTSAGTTEVSVGITPSGSTTTIFFFPRYDQQITEDQQDALAGNSGTPSASNTYVTEAYLSSSSGLPVVRAYKYTSVGATNTQFDITNPSGTTFRYTYDGTGTDPVINATTFPIGTQVDIYSTSIAVVNQGYFVVTGSGANYFEITNASGTAENNKTLANGFLYKNSSITWTKPAGLKYAVVETQAGGGGGGGVTTDDTAGGGGGGGGYSKKLVAVASLGATETVAVGSGGLRGAVDADGGTGGTSSFGSHLSATGGTGGKNGSSANGGTGGIGSNGDINCAGGGGGSGAAMGETTSVFAGTGGSSILGGGAEGHAPGNADANGSAGGVYGGGGGGGANSNASALGGVGAPGIIIVTEYYS